MHPLLRPAYAAAGAAARLAAALAPAGEGKLARTLRARRGVRTRLAAWGAAHRDPARPLLWMHAPSVGEGLQARPVLELARRLRPDVQLAYTFFSPSAERFARGLDVDVVEYLPFDTAGDAAAALDTLRPTALVFAKLDVWPVLVERAARRGVRLGLVSATLAPGSSRGGGVSRALLRDAYRSLDAVGAISADDAARLVALGVRPERVRVTGDTRYDQVWARARDAEAPAALARPPLAPLQAATRGDRRRFTLVAGSTWPADEAVLLPAWTALVADGRAADAGLPGAPCLVLCPHEPTPAHLAPLEAWAARERLRLVRLGAAEAAWVANGVPPDADVVLVDRVGVLGDLYALADAAFVGGGYHAAGLHSVLEPAAFGTPVVFGPRHANAREAGLLLNAGGAVAAPDAASLALALRRWRDDAPARNAAGRSAQALVAEGRRAAARAWALVAALLDG